MQCNDLGLSGPAHNELSGPDCKRMRLFVSMPNGPTKILMHDPKATDWRAFVLKAALKAGASKAMLDAVPPNKTVQIRLKGGVTALVEGVDELSAGDQLEVVLPLPNVSACADAGAGAGVLPSLKISSTELSPPLPAVGAAGVTPVPLLTTLYPSGVESLRLRRNLATSHNRACDKITFRSMPPGH